MSVCHEVDVEDPCDVGDGLLGMRQATEDVASVSSMTIIDQQGYDYEFIPCLDKKFECPICLLGMREPVQTNCGHRFCEECIQRWLKKKGERCPEDNLPLNAEPRFFHDLSTKREILSLMVKCPNSRNGCDSILELRAVKNHVDKCVYSMQPCPNQCGTEVSVRDMGQHLKVECVRRMVMCDLCHQEYHSCSQKIHDDSCSEARVKCQFCDEPFTRGMLSHHITKDCAHAQLECGFSPMGCKEKSMRTSMVHHESQAIPFHLNLLRDFVVDVQRRVKDLGTSIQSCVSSPVAAAGLSTSARPDYDEIEVAKRALYLPLSAGSPQALHSPQATPQNGSITDKVLELERKLVLSEQKNRELELKLTRLEQTACSARDVGRSLTARLDALDACPRTGVYVWRVRGMSSLRRENPATHIRVIHSPGFYTSQYGYKLCLRLNINGRRTTHARYISLFIHFMRGENDDILQWPFTGAISLCIMDQRELPEERSHITEQFTSQPHLAAFQKPTQERNAKGFGYMEFAPLEFLDNAFYIKEDALVIKADVKLG